MKRLLAALSVAVLVLGFAACNKKKEETTPEQPASSEPAPSADATPTEPAATPAATNDATPAAATTDGTPAAKPEGGAEKPAEG